LCVEHVAGLPAIPEKETRVSGPLLSSQRMLKEYVKHELDKHHTSPNETKTAISIEDVKYLLDYFEGVSVLSGGATGRGRLIRWREDCGLQLYNLIYLTANEFAVHEKITSVEEAYDPELVKKVDELLLNLKEELS